MSFNRRDLLLTGTGAAAALSVASPALAQNSAMQSIPATPANTSGVPNKFLAVRVNS